MFIYIRLVYLILSFYHLASATTVKDACVECNNGLELARSQAFRWGPGGGAHWPKTTFQVYVTTIYIV